MVRRTTVHRLSKSAGAGDRIESIVKQAAFLYDCPLV